jgi:hypothetical protein
MRLRTRTDAVARLLLAVGLPLVLGAGGVEALRSASPAAYAAEALALAQAAPTVGPTQQTPGATATPVIRPPERPAQAVIPLPHTSATAPVAGAGFVLVGFALILHGARRVRGRQRELNARIAAFPRLRVLVRTIGRLQHDTVETTEELDEQVRLLSERLSPP